VKEITNRSSTADFEKGALILILSTFGYFHHVNIGT